MFFVYSWIFVTFLAIKYAQWWPLFSECVDLAHTVVKIHIRRSASKLPVRGLNF